MSFTIRALDKTRDREGVEAVDTAFATDVVFDLVTTARRIELRERALAQPMTKRYDIGEVFAPWARWTRGWVAEDAARTIQGFATAQYEGWNGRAILWFLYIAPAWRKRGVGRALVGEVEAFARQVGASHLWLETSTVNVPGVTAYERMGFSLVGADRLLYGEYMPNEQAIYLAKSL